MKILSIPKSYYRKSAHVSDPSAWVVNVLNKMSKEEHQLYKQLLENGFYQRKL